jgi:2-polyprenyl-3-methyl-5-hydroxy-6-metoxy-1,4-benzoquinol methylase
VATLNSNWHAVWQAKGLSQQVIDPAREDFLDTLMEFDGYFSPTSTLSRQDYDVFFRYVVDALGIGRDDSVYEVGCGAGALLYWLRSRCRTVGGADFAESLIAHARTALPDAGELRHCEARDITLEPYDVVLSTGVFIYFRDEEYARDVLRKMIAKARRGIGVFDVNDADRRAESEAARRRAQGDRARDYAGVEQLYLRRRFFEEIADEYGLACRIDESALPDCVNARYRYHVVMVKPPHS